MGTNIRQSLYQCLENEIVLNTDANNNKKNVVKLFKPEKELESDEIKPFAIDVYISFKSKLTENTVENNFISIKFADTTVSDNPFYKIEQANLGSYFTKEENTDTSHNVYFGKTDDGAFYMYFSDIGWLVDSDNIVTIRKEIKYGEFSSLLSSAEYKVDNTGLAEFVALSQDTNDMYGVSNGRYVESEGIVTTANLQPGMTNSFIGNSEYDADDPKKNKKFLFYGDFKSGLEGIKLTKELKTYYPIGKIQDAKTNSPKTIGNKDDSLAKVFDNIIGLDRLQPIVTKPKINSVSFTPDTNGTEYGTKITSLTYKFNTDNGSYTYGPNNTGVTWSNYKITNYNINSSSGTINIDYTVGESSDLSFNCSAQYSDGRIALDNAGDPSCDPDTNEPYQIKSDTAYDDVIFSVQSTYYPYYKMDTRTSISTLEQYEANRSTNSSCTVNGVSPSYTVNSYVWFFFPNGTTGNKKIQYESLGEWYDFDTDSSSGTKIPMNAIRNTGVSIVLNSGKTLSSSSGYVSYRSNGKATPGQKFRIVNN